MAATSFATRLGSILILSIVCACGGNSAPPGPEGLPPVPEGARRLGLEPAFPDLDFDLPVALVQAPADAATWFVVEQRGTIRRFANREDASESALFLDIRDRVADPRENWEYGLLGLAFHPHFPGDRRAFVYYTSVPPSESSCGEVRLSSFLLGDEGDRLDPQSEAVLFRHKTSCREYQGVHQSFHHGGTLRFDSRGLLWIGVGDLNGRWHAPDPATLPGSLLRIDVDAATPYGVPPDNPFVEGGGRPEVFAYGFRNPWKWSFDRKTGAIWVGDVGQSGWEEVDRVERGANYGWPECEGFECEDDRSDELVAPLVSYSHDEGCSVTGGYVYRGASHVDLQGVYLYADFCAGTIWGIFAAPDGSPRSVTLAQTGFMISSFAEDASGELYVIDLYGGIHRVSGLSAVASEQRPGPQPSDASTQPDDLEFAAIQGNASGTSVLLHNRSPESVSIGWMEFTRTRDRDIELGCPETLDFEGHQVRTSSHERGYDSSGTPLVTCAAWLGERLTVPPSRTVEVALGRIVEGERYEMVSVQLLLSPPENLTPLPYDGKTPARERQTDDSDLTDDGGRR